jgi:hypothetical protein
MPRTQIEHRAAIAKRVGQLLRKEGSRWPADDPDGATAIVVVLPGDSVRSLCARLAEYPGGVVVVAESGDGLVMTAACLKYVKD